MGCSSSRWYGTTLSSSSIVPFATTKLLFLQSRTTVVSPDCSSTFPPTLPTEPYDPSFDTQTIDITTSSVSLVHDLHVDKKEDSCYIHPKLSRGGGSSSLRNVDSSSQRCSSVDNTLLSASSSCTTGTSSVGLLSPPPPPITNPQIIHTIPLTCLSLPPLSPTTTSISSSSSSSSHNLSNTNKYIREPFFWSTTRFIDDSYEIGPMLGKGNFGTVFKGYHKYTRETVAIKRINKQRTKSVYIENEILTMRLCVNHPSIVQLYCVYETPNYVYMVLEYLAGGELFSRLVNLGAYSEIDAREPVKNIIEALMHLHKQGIIHRDLKPENLLLTQIPTIEPTTTVTDRTVSPPSVIHSSSFQNYHVKIADLGLAKQIIVDKNSINIDGTGTTPKLIAICGTWAYSSPEMRDPTRPGYSTPMDCFALGVIMYIILSGFHPFDPYGTAGQTTILRAIQSQPVQFDDPVWDTVSDDAKDLIQKLLRKNPSERYTAEQAYHHRWIQNTSLSITPLRENIGNDLDNYRKQMAKKLRASIFVAVASIRLMNVGAGRRWSAPSGPMVTNMIGSIEDKNDHGKGTENYNVPNSDPDEINRASGILILQTNNESSLPGAIETTDVSLPSSTVDLSGFPVETFTLKDKSEISTKDRRRHSIMGIAPVIVTDRINDDTVLA